MRLYQILSKLDESLLTSIAGFIAGWNAPKSIQANAGMLMLTALSTYEDIEKIAAPNRKKIVVTSDTTADTERKQKIVDKLLSKMEYKLERLEKAGLYGKKWTLTAK